MTPDANLSVPQTASAVTSSATTTDPALLTAAWARIVKAGYYPVPYARRADGTLDFQPNTTGGHADPRHADVRPGDEFIGFRLPDSVIALDVDHYDGKTGADHLAAYREAAGLPELPPTFRVTSRGADDPGGKYLYRTDAWGDGDLPVTAIPQGDVDVISRWHKFVAGYPGTLHHKTGTVIRCYGPDGTECALPDADALPYLPVEWEVALTREPEKLATGAVVELPKPDGHDCPHARAWLDGATKIVRHEKTGLPVLVADPTRPGADFGQVRGARAMKAVRYLRSMAHHGHHVGQVYEDARAAFPVLAGTIDQRWDGKAPDADDLAPGCCKESRAATSSPAPQTAESAPQPGKRKRTTAADVTMVPVEWVWEPYVPAGMLTVLAGREGTGKSQLAIALAVEHVLSQGRSVILISPEDPRDSVTVPRLVVAGADRKKVRFYDAEPGDEPVTLRTDLDDLADYAREADAGLIIFDPIVSAMDADTDENSYKEVSAELERLSVWADKTGTAVIAITHNRKSDATDAINKVMSSKAFTTKPRSVIMCGFHEEVEGVCVMTHVKSNVGPAGATLYYKNEPMSIHQGATVIPTSRARLLTPQETAAVQQQAKLNKDGKHGGGKIEQCASAVREFLGKSCVPGAARTVAVKAHLARTGYGQKLADSPEVRELAGVHVHCDGGVKPVLHYWSLRANPTVFNQRQLRLLTDGPGLWMTAHDAFWPDDDTYSENVA